MTTDTATVRRCAIRWAGILLSLFVAAFLLFEGFWFATLRGSAHGIPERQARLWWWTIAEAASFAGVLLCDAFAASLIARSKRDGAASVPAFLQTPLVATPQWNDLFVGFILSLGATVLLALGWVLL